MDAADMWFFGFILICVILVCGVAAVAFSESLLERCFMVVVTFIGCLSVGVIFFGG